MGLNWAEGLKQAGAGMDTLGAAMEKTDELEYRNIRDKNLRRFQLEDQARTDKLTGEKREYEEGQQAEKDVRKDEELGISPETERGEAILTKEEKDRKDKQTDSLERIAANIKARGVKSKETRSEYIQARMKEMYAKYIEDQGVDLSEQPEVNEDGTIDSRMMPMFDRDMWIGRHGDDYDAFMSAGSESEETPEPFAEPEKPREGDVDKEGNVVNWEDL